VEEERVEELVEETVEPVDVNINDYFLLKRRLIITNKMGRIWRGRKKGGNCSVYE
jgi:hypothetical protein